MVALVKLVTYEKPLSGYITYVFECLDEEVKKETKYLMCVRFPNWDHRNIELDEIGYLEFEEIRAGMTKWFNGTNMIPYRYNMIQFIRFIRKIDKEDEVYKI